MSERQNNLMGRLKEVICSITNRCNLRCKMCEIPLNMEEELSTEVWKGVIEDAAFIGAQTMVFSGGEPLIREDLFELIHFSKKNHMNACLTSNGGLINEAIAFKLKKSGVDVVNISIEGPQDIHDSLRGEGAFKKAISALGDLKKHNIETTIATVISKYNYRHLNYLVGLAKDNNVTTIRFQPFSAIFMKEHSPKSSFLIEEDTLDDLGAVIENITKACHDNKIATNSIGYMKEIPFYFRDKDQLTRNGCSSLWSSAPINVKGEVFPCWVLNKEKHTIGNISTQRFRKIWNSKKHQKIKEKIIEKGCPGCMMSCYDDAFGKDVLKKMVAKKIQKLKTPAAYKRAKNKIIQFVRGILHRSELRYKYYSSYRGSKRKLMNRLVCNVKRKVIRNKISEKGQRQNLIKDVLMQKQKIKNKMSEYK